MAGVILVALLLLLGAAAALGLTEDSRDSSYGLGPVTAYRRRRSTHDEEVRACEAGDCAANAG